MRFRFILFCFLLFLGNPTFADGNKLISQCSDAIHAFDTGTVRDAHNIAACAGYIEGIVDTLRTLEKNQTLLSVCWPEQPISTAQVVRVVYKYLQENPAQLHFPKAYLVFGAIEKGFPCN